jgi:TonB family protein
MKCGHERMLMLSLLLPMAVFAQQSPDISVAIRDEMKLDSAMFNQDPKKKEPPADYVQYDQPPEPIRPFQPDYPSEALSRKQEGEVWVKLWVGETGTVVEANVIKSDAEVFNKSAIEAGMRWTFKPAIVNGKPVAVWVTLPFRFKLYEGKEAPSIGPGVKAPGVKMKTRIIQGEMPSQDPGVKAPGVKMKTRIIQEEKPPADYVPYEKPPEAIKQVPAKYPPDAKKDNVEGTVWLKTLVDEEGRVAKVEIQKSEAEVLNQAAVDAVKQWVFKPAIMKGKPVAVWVSIPFRFKLASDQEKPSKK